MNKEQEKISNRNKYKAAKHFNLQKGYVLHHKDPTWKHDDIERYIQWNPEDLVVMTKSEHAAFHNSCSDFRARMGSDDPWRWWNEGVKNKDPERWHKSQSKAVSNRNRTCWKNPDYREHMKKAIQTAEGYSVRCVELNIVFSSLNEALKETGISKYFIKKSANTGIPVKGYTFEWVERSLPS